MTKRSVDFKLVVNAQKDVKNFGALYQKYYKPIFIYVFKKIQSEEITADVTSKVFLNAMTSIHKYRDMGYPFSSWLYKIASNEVNKHFRELNKSQVVEINEKDAITVMKEIDVNENEIDFKKLLACISELKPHYASIIEMRFFDELSFNEIGEILGIKGNNAKIRLYRAIDQLKKTYKD